MSRRIISLASAAMLCATQSAWAQPRVRHPSQTTNPTTRSEQTNGRNNTREYSSNNNIVLTAEPVRWAVMYSPGHPTVSSAITFSPGAIDGLEQRLQEQLACGRVVPPQTPVVGPSSLVVFSSQPVQPSPVLTVPTPTPQQQQQQTQQQSVVSQPATTVSVDVPQTAVVVPPPQQPTVSEPTTPRTPPQPPVVPRNRESEPQQLPPQPSGNQTGTNSHSESAATQTPPLGQQQPQTVVPSDSSIAGCAFDTTVHQFDLTTPGAHGLQPAYISTAASGRRFVALVLLSRPASPRQLREGAVFPQARMLIWDDVTAVNTTVHNVEVSGLEPDAVVGVHSDGTMLVLSPSRVDVRGDAAALVSSVRVTVLNRDGSTAVATRTLDQSAGLRVDSRIITDNDGFAVILGRENPRPDSGPATAQEWLYRFDRQGALRHAPVMITDAQSDDALGRFRVGIATITQVSTQQASTPGSGNQTQGLGVAWTVADGPNAGVLFRRWNNGVLGPTVRVSERVGWGAEIASDLSGIVFRTGGERGQPLDIVMAPLTIDNPTATASLWNIGRLSDPLVAVVNGRAIVSGVGFRTSTAQSVQALLGVAQSPFVQTSAQQSSGVLPLRSPQGISEDLSNAVDVDLSAVDTGAAVAWIQSDPWGDAHRPRSVRIARVTCR